MRLSTYILAALLAVPAATSAQNPAELDFVAKNKELGKVFFQERKKGDYAACEKTALRQIALFESMDSLLSEPFNFFKYKSYYNLACAQSLMGKKREAVQSLANAYSDGKFEITYKSVMSDPDFSNIHDEEGFKDIVAKIKEASDYLAILKSSPAYSKGADTSALPKITYLPESDENLRRVRQYFRLDSVAENCGELDRIKRILTYVHDMIRQDGTNANVTGGRNSINYAEKCRGGAHSLNCRGMATVLNECYLSMGIKSRVITCLPKRFYSDCHVINAVYSSTLGKWLWIDPTENAWVTDDEGNMLSVPEVRERLRTGLPVHVNDEANWNNERKTTTENYLYEYMAKNLYYIECWTHYGFNTESEGDNPVNYIMLQPTGCESDQKLQGSFAVNDDDYFWAAPDA